MLGSAPASHTARLSGWLDARDCGASGSEFETLATVRAQSNRIELSDVGDFAAGQYVTVSRCHPHYKGFVYADRPPYLAENIAPLKDEVELRGFHLDKEWQVFVLHFENTRPLTFSWLVVDHGHQPLVRRWTWQGRGVPCTADWTPLMDGVEIRFRKTDWRPGQAIAFHARSRLITRITGVEGKTLVLADAPSNDQPQARVRHLDQFALQQAVDQAVAERKALFIPAGRYRLTDGLILKEASARIEGEHRDQTILDISDGVGAVFWLVRGKDIAVRNLAMTGHTGFQELPWYSFPTVQRFAFWPTANQQMEVKGCAAANIWGTEHVLFEDVKVSRMASEAFYSHGPNRGGPRRDRGFGTFSWSLLGAAQETSSDAPADPGYTKSIVYHRCVVCDSASNAFNNNDWAENTSILHCHVERVHNFWEGGNRFTRAIGNYVRHAHAGTYVGGGRSPELLSLGTGQAMICNNVFEGGEFGRGIYIEGATQVRIADNLFINWSNATAIDIIGINASKRCPARTVTVTGNLMDLTHVPGQLDNERVGIAVSASNVVVANNQVFLRGPMVEKVTGIQVSENAMNVLVHDNLIENCGYGFRTGYSFPIVSVEKGLYEGEGRRELVDAEVVQSLGPDAFIEKGLPTVWGYAGGYGGWHLRWLDGANAGVVSTIAEYDSDTRRVVLREALDVHAGDRFAACPARVLWSIHDNTINGCGRAIVLSAHGSETACVKDNLISPLPLPEER